MKLFKKLEHYPNSCLEQKTKMSNVFWNILKTVTKNRPCK